MSNTNAPFGFRWLGMNRGGGVPTMSLVPRKIAAGNSSPICRGDVVQSLTTGYIGIGAQGVVVSQCAGIFWGVEYLSTSQGKKVLSNYWPSGDHAYDGDALIIPIMGVAPQLFYCQALSTNFTFADVGANCDINVGTQTIAGGYGKSGMTLDRTYIGATASLPFRIIDMYSNIVAPGTPGTDDTSSYNIVVVQSNSLQETGLNT